MFPYRNSNYLAQITDLITPTNTCDESYHSGDMGVEDLESKNLGKQKNILCISSVNLN